MLRCGHLRRYPAGFKSRASGRRYALQTAAHGNIRDGILRLDHGPGAHAAPERLRVRRTHRGTPQPAYRTPGDLNGLGGNRRISWRSSLGHDRDRSSDRRGNHRLRPVSSQTGCQLPGSYSGGRRGNLSTHRVINADFHRGPHSLSGIQTINGLFIPGQLQADKDESGSGRSALRLRSDHGRGFSGHLNGNSHRCYRECRRAGTGRRPVRRMAGYGTVNWGLLSTVPDGGGAI